MKRALAILLGLVLLTACGEAGVFDQPFKQGPQLETVTVHVVWTDKATIERQCGNPNAYACATVGTERLPYSTIWAIKPRSFSHAPLVEALGHEFMHSLGATH